MAQPKHHPTRRRLLLVLLIVTGIAAVVVWQRQNIIDEIHLHTYTPPLAITRLVQDDELTPYGQQLLYMNRPSLLSSRTAFNTHCPPGSEQTVVLGCYHSVENGIYLFAVSDPTLTGVEQVTAAHEMLHAAYDRLSTTERTQVDGWIENYYQHDLHNAFILSEIATYRQTEPNAVVNEMHSVFGTQIADLPPQLAAYYQRYFKNRQVIVNYANAYEQTLSSRETAVNQDDTQLTALKATITTNEATLKTETTELAAELQTLNQARTSGNTTGYNDLIPGYNQGAASYNALVTTTESLVTQYNQLVVSRNAIALQAQTLQNELIGTLTPVAQQ